MFSIKCDDRVYSIILHINGAFAHSLCAKPLLPQAVREAIALCLHPEASKRLNPDQLLHILQLRTCEVCTCDDAVFKQGISCTGGDTEHFFCRDCFDGLVVHQTDLNEMSEIAKRKGELKCCFCPEPEHAIKPVLPAHVELVQKAQVAYARWQTAQVGVYLPTFGCIQYQMTSFLLATCVSSRFESFIKLSPINRCRLLLFSNKFVSFKL
jgi:hypothetical protein